MARKRGERKIGGHTAENMLRALILHRQGLAIRQAARTCNILYSTLNRYVKKYATISTEELKNQRLTPHYNVNMIFTAEQEAELTAYIKECTKTKALSTKEVRRAAYELAAVNDIETPESWERKQMAGIDWLKAFKKRNFGPKKPEGATVNAIEEVVKELIGSNDNKVCSLDKALKTLEVHVDRKVSDDGNAKLEDSYALAEKLKSNTIDLVTEDQEIVEVNSNDNSDLILDVEEVGIAGATVNDGNRTEKIYVKNEVEPQSSDEECSQYPLSDKEEAEDEASTNVWSYYERESGARARCVVCRAVVARADLKLHLKANHPKLVAEIDLGSNDEASEEESQEDLYTEIVYLEEEQNAKKQKSTPKPKLKPKPKPYVERPEPRKRQASSSSDEVPLRRKKTKTTHTHTDEQPENNDEIEQFGKYVTCLLKKIPAAACMELQAEIINLIMKKQLELKRNETSVLAGDKMAGDKMAGDKMAGEKMAETAGDNDNRADAFENIASTSSFNISNGSNVIKTTE